MRTLQSITPLPLQIDTSDLKAMERALRLYNGRPLLNSVNGKTKFPFVGPALSQRSMAAMLVGLCLDDDGIAESLEGRLKSARRVIDGAKKAGLSEKALLLDPLAMTISTGGQNAQIALSIIAALKRQDLSTVMGVSNISFGLLIGTLSTVPFLPRLCSWAFRQASSNPNSAPMMETYLAYGALSGYDTSCKAYVSYLRICQQKKGNPMFLPQKTAANKAAMVLTKPLKRASSHRLRRRLQRFWMKEGTRFPSSMNI